jgi:hypothetical protein
MLSEISKGVDVNHIADLLEKVGRGREVEG